MLAAMRMVRWDMLLQVRSHLYSATALTTIVFCLVTYFLGRFDLSSQWLAFLLIADPAVIGLSFVGAFILMERGGNTLSALSVTPLQGWVYVLGKIVSFTILGTLSGAAVAVAAAEGQLNYPIMTVSLVMTNALAVLIGFCVAARASSVNNFLVRMVFAMLIITLPALAYLGLVPGQWGAVMGIIPTFSMLVLLEAGFAENSVSVAQYAGHTAYVLAWIVAGWFFAVREYEQSIRHSGL